MTKKVDFQLKDWNWLQKLRLTEWAQLQERKQVLLNSIMVLYNKVIVIRLSI